MRFRKYLFATLALVCLLLTVFFILYLQQAKADYEAVNGVFEYRHIPPEFILAYSCTALPGAMLTLGFGALAYFYHQDGRKHKTR